MHNFQVNYDKILTVLQSKISFSSGILQKRRPKLSDIELVAIELTAQYMSIDSEHQLFRLLKSIKFKSLVHRSVYNRRKRKLAPFLEQIRVRLSEHFNSSEDIFIIDSMPLEACKLSRSSRSKICKEQFYSAPDKGYCAAQNTYFYGYKLHAVCSIQGVFKSIDISKASVHDIHYLKDIKTQHSDCVIVGDKGYLNREQQLDLFQTAKITLQGFKTRILSKITALTLIQFINKVEFNRPINNLKIQII